MIRRILRTRLKSGFVFYRLGVKKETGNYIAGFKAFKVDKREDGWIEIRDAGNWKLWGLVKRFEALGYGALYLGFGVDRRPLAYFIPYRKRIKLENVKKSVRDIHKHFPFLRLHWTLRGGSETGGLLNFRTEIIDLFRFVRFLSPLPSDVMEIEERIGIRHYFVQRLVADVFLLPLSVLLRGTLVYKVVLSLVSGNVLKVGDVPNVLKVREVPILGKREERGKYEVLGGYIPSPFPFVGGIIKVDVWSSKTFMAVVGFSGISGKVLQCCVKKEDGNNDRQGQFV